MAREQSNEDEQVPIETGRPVFSEEGDELGVIMKLTSEGFEVSTERDYDHDAAATDGRTAETTTQSPPGDTESDQEHNPGQEFGEGYIMWRCQDCGEMGKLDDGFPDRCPDCGSEAVYKWKED